MTVVDAHVHIWRAAQTPTTVSTIVSPSDDVPIDLLSQYLDEHRVDRAVLVQPAFRRDDNAYVADVAAESPDRYAAVCAVHPQRPDAIRHLRYWIEARGCKGLRLRPRVSEEAAAFGLPSTHPLWEYSAAHGVVVSVYAGPEHLCAISTLADHFPGVAVILDHMAHPAVSMGTLSPSFRDLLALARHPRVFVKVSGYYHFSAETYPYRDCWELFRALYDAFGPARLIWGSDFPHVLLRSGYRRSLLLQERAYTYLTHEDLDRVMGGNAEALYWGPGP